MIRLLWLAPLLTLVACGSSPPKTDGPNPVDVARILKQVNDAVESSVDPKDKDFPPISSVNLDLQVTVEETLSPSLPVELITAGIKLDKQNLHHILLTFVPAPVRKPAADTKPSAPPSKLASAIRSVYQSVSHAGNAYKFQRGSITLQCVFKTEIDAGVSALGLVPLSADASTSNQTVQTLTLYFGESPAYTSSPGSSQSLK